MADPKVAGTIPADKSVSQKAHPRAEHPRPDRPSKPLPTDRIGFEKQLQLLRGYAALVNQGVAVPTNPAVAELVGMHRNTAILAHPFFIDIGFLSRSGEGYVPAQEVLAYAKAYHWNPETAPQKLAPILRRTWFAQAIVPRLALGTLDDKKALEVLGIACGAAPRYEGQLKPLLQYLTAAAIIKREGDTYTRSEPGAVEADPDQPKPDAGPAKDASSKEAARVPAVATAFAQVPEGVLRFSVDVNVEMQEFATWTPERISAFWAGIAQVLAAKAAVEAKAKG